MRAIRIATAALAILGLSYRSCSSDPIRPTDTAALVTVPTNVEVPAAEIDPTASRDLPPEIKIAQSPQGCTSSSLLGDGSDRGFLIIDQPGDTVSVDWQIDGHPLGSSGTAPFIAETNDMTPIPAPLGELRAGTHEIRALVHRSDASELPIFTSIVVPENVPEALMTVIASNDAGAEHVVQDWEFLQGRLSFAAQPSSGHTLSDVRLDDNPLDSATSVDVSALLPGRHVITATVTPPPTGTSPAAVTPAEGAAGPLPSVSVTFVSTAGQPIPDPCTDIAVGQWGAIPDDGLDDSVAVSTAMDIAMAAGAVIQVPSGVFDVAKLSSSIPAELIIEGSPGAMLDAHRPLEKYSMFSVNASVTITGVGFRNGGRVFTFDNVSRRVERFIVQGCTFEQVYSPAHLTTPPAEPVDFIRFDGNVVTDSVKGLYLPLRIIGHARVTANTVTNVTDAALRLGSDFDDSFGTQRDIDVRDNNIAHVGGPSDANGIKVLGADGLIIGNTIEDIASDDLSDSEGIYTKGFGHLIAGNHLLDAGRTQAQINIKSDSTTVSDNTIITDRAVTNGIRIEGSDVTVLRNTISGGGPEFIGITTKLIEGFSGYTIEGNTIENTDGIGISIGGNGPLIIRSNTLRNVRGMSGIEIRSTRADTRNVLVDKNVIENMIHPESRALFFEARADHQLTDVAITGNIVNDVAVGIKFEKKKGSILSNVTASNNTWNTRVQSFVGDYLVDNFVNS